MGALTTFLAESNRDFIDTSDFVPVVIGPGRFVPPHLGHRFMIKTLVRLGEQLNAKPVVIIVDSGKYGARNPLPGNIRQKYLQKIAPKVEYIIAPNPYTAVMEMIEKKQVPVGGVTGIDRADSYKKMIGRIFGPKIEESYLAETLYRDPDSDREVTGASATKAREFAVNKDEGGFRAITGLEHEDAIELMNMIRKGMGIK